MRKKKHPRDKNKNKIFFSRLDLRNLYFKQLKDRRGGITVLSFFKCFKNLGISTSLRIPILLGCKYNYRIKRLKLARRHKWLFKLIALKFYLNYAYIKKEKFEILKTLVTFKSLRYYFSLPMRGQRTKTNAKTRKKYSII